MADNNDSKTLVRQIFDRIDSCRAILDTEDLPENAPSLSMVLGLATVLDEKLSGLTGVESVTDERAREAGDDNEMDLIRESGAGSPIAESDAEPEGGDA